LIRRRPPRQRYGGSRSSAGTTDPTSTWHIARRLMPPRVKPPFITYDAAAVC
jgi:hypothetical protein